MLPKKLVLNNFLSHSHSSIDFSKFNTALILGKFNDNTDESNGSGKSSILNGIEWSIFGKSRHKKKDKVVKRDKRECSVQFDFQIKGKTYRILRKRNKVLSESDVLLYQQEGEDWTNISCDTNTATDTKIIKLINFNHEIFINSVYFKQGDMSIFTDSTAGQRKDIIKSLMKLEIWDEYQKKAKTYARDFSVKIEEKKTQIKNTEEIDAEIKQLEQNIKEMKIKLASNNNTFNQLSTELVAKKSAYSLVADVDVKKEIKNAQKQYKEKKAEINIIRNQIRNNENSTKKHQSLLKSIDTEARKTKEKIDALKLIDLNNARTNILQGRTKEQVLRQNVANLQKTINLKKCDTCLRPIESPEVANEIKRKRKEELAKTKNEHARISKKLKVAEEKLKKLEKAHKRRDSLLATYNDLMIKMSSLQNSIGNLKTEKGRREEDIDKINISQYSKAIEDIKIKYHKVNIEEMSNVIEELEERLESLRRGIDDRNIKLGSLVNARNDLIKRKEEQAKLQKDLNSLNGQYLLYDKLIKYFGKDGVQSVIIENIIGELEKYSNQILSKICNEPTSISIATQRQTERGTWTETFDIVVNINGITDDLGSLSGGEQFRVSLSLRLALSKILSKRMNGEIQFILFDECGSSLDNKGLRIFADIISKLGNDMKVLVISHDDRLKSQFQDIIMINKDETGSSVIV